MVYRYNDFGVDLLGSALIVSQSFAERNPETVRRFVRASLAGIRDALADPKGGMAQLKQRDPLFNEAIELERFEMVRDLTMLTDNVKRNGLSAVRAASSRKRSIPSVSCRRRPNVASHPDRSGGSLRYCRIELL
jgi:NitT/TauT family transport system substrate-binding protein